MVHIQIMNEYFQVGACCDFITYESSPLAFRLILA
jgi:hypothetical protein